MPTTSQVFNDALRISAILTKAHIVMLPFLYGTIKTINKGINKAMEFKFPFLTVQLKPAVK